MIKGVIFDLGGVLLDNPACNMRSYISKSLNISEKEFTERSSLPFLDFQKGLISEQEFWRKVTHGLVFQEKLPDSLWKEAIKSSFSPKQQERLIENSFERIIRNGWEGVFGRDNDYRNLRGALESLSLSDRKKFNNLGLVDGIFVEY